MPMGLWELSRQVPIQLASYYWTTTVSSQSLVAAPSSGEAITIHYIACHQSAAAGILHITPNTTAGSSYFVYNGTGPHEELALIPLANAEAMELHMAATGGAGFIRVYYSIRTTTGT